MHSLTTSSGKIVPPITSRKITNWLSSNSSLNFQGAKSNPISSIFLGYTSEDMRDIINNYEEQLEILKYELAENSNNSFNDLKTKHVSMKIKSLEKIINAIKQEYNIISEYKMKTLKELLIEVCRKTGENQYTLYSKHKQSDGHRQNLGTFTSSIACNQRDKAHKKKKCKHCNSKKKKVSHKKKHKKS